MPGTDEIQVHMCKVAVGRPGDVLRATLGSCVGIGFLWRDGGMCGLAHCLLPSTSASPLHIGAKYVTEALPSLLTLMRLQPRHYRAVDAVIAGGASMVERISAPFHEAIGDANAKAARDGLARLGIRLVADDTGGKHGRQITIDCANYTSSVRFIDRPT
ncbi:chemotaxis protein CheD [Dyella sp. A6]|uniref:chemotaxis protein CheD n=1 Tax=Dyella aluminiiresistens TaxID=3069105 RepID=UPI002E78F4E4|nr:chemotaxis protein CheD [Dyella sp. A6]